MLVNMRKTMSEEIINLDEGFNFDGLSDIYTKSVPVAKQPAHNTTVFQSALCAFEGLRYTFLTERNFRIQLILGAGAICLGFIRGISNFEMLLLWLSIILVMACEIVNTALELTLDVLSKNKYHPLVKIAKDVVAAAVLLAAVNALVIGVIVFSGYLQ
jgi:diacylglycerol kinase